jgi:hypothetical protein
MVFGETPLDVIVMVVPPGEGTGAGAGDGAGAGLGAGGGDGEPGDELPHVTAAIAATTTPAISHSLR